MATHERRVPLPLLIAILIVAVLGAGRAKSQAVCDLTPEQWGAVSDAVLKLKRESDDWPDDDDRWGPLEDLWEGLGMDNCLGCGVQTPINIDSTKFVGEDPPFGMTRPRGRKMSGDEFNDISLNKDQWMGPANDLYGSTDTVAACWILSGVLLHEGSHQDDDYPWPPPPGLPLKDYYCQEVEGGQIEGAFLCEAPDDGTLSNDGLEEVKERKKRVERVTRDKETKKDG